MSKRMKLITFGDISRYLEGPLSEQGLPRFRVGGAEYATVFVDSIG